MPGLHDTSSIPDGAEYWDALAERVAREAAQARVSSIDWVAARPARGIAVATLAGAAAVLLALSSAALSRPGVQEQWAQALAPSDALARSLSGADAPPALLTLLLDQRGEARRGR